MSLQDVAKRLVMEGKGILAADESLPTIEKRFSAHGIENSFENRKAYREMLFSTVGLEEYISGVILFEETVEQGLHEVLTNKGIMWGIKVDEGVKDGVTQGSETLQTKLDMYKKMGATFCKWRAVFEVGLEIKSANVENLALYAKKCQESGLVPIVEPEVLWKEGIDVNEYALSTSKVLARVFEKLFDLKVRLEEMILKPNMIVGTTSQQTAKRTVEVMQKGVSVAVPGIAFLSGGQTETQATENLNEINKMGAGPWKMTYSFGRALQNSALTAWGGKSENVSQAQEKLLHRAKMNSLASMGKYVSEKD